MLNSNSILEGIRVVDLTRVLTGPFCAMMLGDMGADIIKVERKGSGDDTRKWGPPFVEDESAYFLSINRNKRSITLNLKSEEGKQVLWELIEGADVVLENFRPGTMARFGFDYEAVKARKPDIVYCSISGFGQEGPASGLTAYDLIVQGMSGVMSVTGPPEMPTKFGVPTADLTAGMFAAYGIMGALFHRLRSGEGQYIDTSMLGGQVAILSYHAGMYLNTGRVPKSTWNAHGIVGPYQTFRAKDGYVNMAVGNDGIWQRFCAAMGLDELGANETYALNGGRMANLPALITEIEAAFGERNSAEILATLAQAGVPAGPILNIDEVFDHPQAEYYQLRQQVEHATLGQINQIGFPYTFSATPPVIRRPPPTLGQHTDEVLDELGYSAEKITALKTSGAV
ncbi:MAG: CaiB/BaiF CoA transferase family protein [Candidatus Promineifilaceae bacterium]